MKTKLHKIIPIFAILFNGLLFSQTNISLEMGKITGDGNPIGNGPALTQTINFLKNSDNPTGNTFTTYTPALSATYTISNSKYATTVNNSTVNFGYDNAAASSIYGPMNSYGGPLDNYFTSTVVANGTGISVANNYAAKLNVLSYPLRVNGLASNGTYAMADLTVTFSRPVNNPIIQIGGLGALVGTGLGVSAGLNLVSSNQPLGSISLTRLSGSNTTAFQVTGYSIFNGSTTYNNSGTNCGSGSVKINGTDITTLTFTVLLSGDGAVAGGNSWATTNSETSSSDSFTMGFSASDLDSDGDGVADISDLDDDNDGILDDDECAIFTNVLWGQAGFTDAGVSAAGGQTVNDIGTALSIPQLNGVAMTVEFTTTGSTTNTSDLVNTNPTSPFFAIANDVDATRTLKITFSKVMEEVSLAYDPQFTEGEGVDFLPTGGTLTNPGPTAGLTITSTGVRNPIDGGGGLSDHLHKQYM